MIGRIVAGIAISAAICGSALAAPALTLEAAIALPNTSGRIDHLAIDLTRRRLFVAELGNGSVDVVDLDSRKVVHRISGLKEPQGVAYVPKSDLLAVANGGDGTLRFYSASDYLPRGMVRLGADADNVRVDPHSGNVVVGYGNGGLAVVDPAKAMKLKDIALPDHPEAFQISRSSNDAYVNVPNAHQIDVVDMSSDKPIVKWATPHLSSNFPMALGDDGAVAVVFRSPARLVRFALSIGQMATTNNTCGDADDVFFDAKRQRYYVSCGAGTIDVFQLAGGTVDAVASIVTSSGARTSLFVPELDRLFLAARAGLLGSDASIQIYRPMP
jgi:hypothetical protein